VGGILARGRRGYDTSQIWTQNGMSVAIISAYGILGIRERFGICFLPNGI
jgi:hypothetical protein